MLLIDEAQGISDGVPGGVPGTLSSIHQGFAATPISFCAFGLPGTWNALSKVDVSRTSSFHDLTLAGLDDAEARMAVDRCFERFRRSERRGVGRGHHRPQRRLAAAPQRLPERRPVGPSGTRRGWG